MKNDKPKTYQADCPLFARKCASVCHRIGFLQGVLPAGLLPGHSMAALLVSVLLRRSPPCGFWRLSFPANDFMLRRGAHYQRKK